MYAHLNKLYNQLELMCNDAFLQDGVPHHTLEKIYRPMLRLLAIISVFDEQGMSDFHQKLHSVTQAGGFSASSGAKSNFEQTKENLRDSYLEGKAPGTTPEQHSAQFDTTFADMKKEELLVLKGQVEKILKGISLEELDKRKPGIGITSDLKDQIAILTPEEIATIEKEIVMGVLIRAEKDLSALKRIAETPVSAQPKPAIKSQSSSFHLFRMGDRPSDNVTAATPAPHNPKHLEQLISGVQSVREPYANADLSSAPAIDHTKGNAPRHHSP